MKGFLYLVENRDTDFTKFYETEIKLYRILNRSGLMGFSSITYTFALFKHGQPVYSMRSLHLHFGRTVHTEHKSLVQPQTKRIVLLLNRAQFNRQ